MSPEQLAGQHVDGRSDLYSLGAMLFQLLTGELPLKADSLAALMYQIANTVPPDVRSLRPELPPALGACLARAMAKLPEQRHQSGAEMAADLRRIAELSGIDQTHEATLPLRRDPSTPTSPDLQV